MTQVQARYLTLIATAEHWEAKGMYEVAEIYYKAAAKLSAIIDSEEF